MKDTANEVASLDEMLESTINRACTARALIIMGADVFLPIILEDLYCGVQLILDNYCVEKDAT